MRGEQLGASTGGVWTATQARAAGLTREQVRRARERGEWQALRPGCYLDGGVTPAPRHRAWAAVLAAGGPEVATAVGRTAARLHGLPLIDDDDPVLSRYEAAHDDVVVATGRQSGRTLHPRRWTYEPGELGTVSTCPTPSLLRTLWDLRLVLRPDALVCALDAARHSGAVTPADLAQACDRSGTRHLRRFGAAAGLADGRAESPLETLVRLAVLPAVPDLVPQVEVLAPDGRILGRVDLGIETVRFGVEADGGTHRGQVSRARDLARERRLRWSLERCTWEEVRARPQQLARRVYDGAEAARRQSSARWTA